MEKKRFSNGLFAVVTVATLALVGFTIFALQNQQEAAPDSNQNQSDTTTGSSESDNAAAPNPSERMTVTYSDNGFDPESLTVKKGTVVTVTNSSSRDAQFSSDDHPAHQDNSEMNLGTLSPGESESYTATEVGTWGFHDHIDESKTGTITVTE